MGEIIEEIIADFTEGITDDPRITTVGLSQMVTNFDIFTNHKRLLPYPDSVSGDNASSTSQKQNFDIANWLPAPDWRLFSLGVKSGAGTAEVLMKTLGVGGSGDLSDATWSAPAANQSASGSTSFNVFKYYKTTGKIYGAKGGNRIWTFTPDGSTAWNDSEASISYTNIAQAIIHSKDDVLYLPYDNNIASNNAGTWTNVAISIPSHLYITSIDEYQDYVVITAAPLSGQGKSINYLWDRDSSLTTLSESYDGGVGQTQVIAELNGDILSISSSVDESRLQSRVTFRKFAGIGFDTFAEFILPVGSNAQLLPIKQKTLNRVFFMMAITIDGIMREGIWSVGITKTGKYGISHEYTPNNDTAVVTNPGGANSGVLKGFFIVGDFFFTSYVDGSANYQLSKTNSLISQGVLSYTKTSIFESVIKNKTDSDLIGRLIGAALMFDPMPANGSAALYFKRNNDTAWTRLFSYSSAGSISKGAINIQSDQNAFTVTIANPAIFTLAKHGLIAGQQVIFSTTGALPLPLVPNVIYFVISTGLTSSTFEVSTTLGGAAVNTTGGSQSGVHRINRTIVQGLPEGKEFKLRAESTGGVNITGIKYKMEVLDKQTF